MDLLHLTPYQGDGLWSLDMFFNLLWKSTVLWLGIRWLAKNLSARAGQRVWRIGLLSLATLFLFISSSLWELQTIPLDESVSLSATPETPNSLLLEAAEEGHTLVPLPANKPLLFQRLHLILILLWSLGFLWVLGKILLEYLLLRKASRSATDFDWSQRAMDSSQLIAQADLVSQPRILISKLVPIPLTFGWYKPVILLPPIATKWSNDRLHQILLHELVHIRRKDYVFNLLAMVVKGFYWFNPLSWTCLPYFRLSREWACDETMIELGIDKYNYTETLVAIAYLPHARHPKHVAPSFAKPSDLNARITRLLRGKKERDSSRWVAYLALISFFVLSIGLMSINLRTIAERPFSQQAFQTTIKTLHDAEETQKIVHLHQLGQWGHRPAFQHIKPYVFHDNLSIRQSALWAAQQIGCLPAFGLIGQQLQAEDKSIRKYSRTLLEEYPSGKLQRYLIDYLDEPRMQDWFVQQFRYIDQQGNLDLLAKHLGGAQVQLQAQCLELLASPSQKNLVRLQQLLHE